MREVGTEAEVGVWPDPIIPTRGLHEAVEMGREIYEREIRHKVEKDHVGKICAIDVDSGCWALGDDRVIRDDVVAVERLREKRPGAVNIYSERVGYWGLVGFAGHQRRSD